MLKEQALFLLQRLEDNGFEAYFVGGCVRDWLLDRPVHDIDICTNAQPCDTMRIFPDHIPTGLKHGTITVKQGPFLYEVTTYRVEGGYTDHRRPSEVTFVSALEQDLARRDFTINALAMDKLDRLIDPFHGQADLDNRLIRAVGDPVQRFSEDALRIVRAVRFAAQLNFSIEEKTVQALAITAPNLVHIAVERIRDELGKLLDCEHPEIGCKWISATDVLRAFPLLAQAFAHGSEQSWRLAKLGSLPQKWAMLLYAAGYSVEQGRAVGELLRLSKRETDAIERFLCVVNDLAPQWDRPERVDWAPLLLRFGFDSCKEIDTLLQAIWFRERTRESSQSLVDTYDRMPVRSLKDLAVTGRDVQEYCQRPPGAWISSLLQYLLEQTALFGLANEREVLLEAARNEVERREHQTRNSQGFS